MIKKLVELLEKYYVIPLIISILIAGFIFYISSIPASGFPSGLGIKTKIYHAIIYLLLALFLTITIVQGKTKRKYFIIVAILITMLYGTTDELHQSFVPGRNPAFTDVMIDSIGILIAGIFYSIRLKFKPHQKFS